MATYVLDCLGYLFVLLSGWPYFYIYVYLAIHLCGLLSVHLTDMSAYLSGGLSVYLFDCYISNWLMSI